MANKIIFGADLIDVLENKYNMNKLGEVPTKYKNGVTTIDFIYGKEKDIDDLKYNKPYVEFSIDDETDGFISGTMYLNGGVEGIQFDSWEDLKYFMKNAKWTESKKSIGGKSLKEEIYDIGDYTYPKIVTADNVDKILKSVKDGILDGYRFNCENIDISDLIYSNSFQKYFLNGGKIEWGKVKKSPFNGELVVLGKLIGNNHYDINIALESKENPFGYSKISHFNFFKKFDWTESKKSARKSLKESKSISDICNSWVIGDAVGKFKNRDYCHKGNDYSVFNIGNIIEDALRDNYILEFDGDNKAKSVIFYMVDKDGKNVGSLEIYPDERYEISNYEDGYDLSKLDMDEIADLFYEFQNNKIEYLLLDKRFDFTDKFWYNESKKSTRKSIKESKVDFQSVIDKVIPKEYAKNKNAYKYALSCVESLYNEDEYDSDSAKVYFLNCYISDSFPSWVDELGEEEMDALANALYDGTMKWSDIDSSWLE